MSHLIPERFRDKTIKHRAYTFATGVAATVCVTAPGTGLAIVPIYMAWHASAAGSFTLKKGSGGSTYFHGAFTINNELAGTPWWDDGASESIGSNTALELVTAATPGAGQFHVWYVVCRLGAGDSGTGQ